MKIKGTIEKIDDPKLISVMVKALMETVIPGNKIIVKYQTGSKKLEVEFGGIYEGS